MRASARDCTCDVDLLQCVPKHAGLALPFFLKYAPVERDVAVSFPVVTKQMTEGDEIGGVKRGWSTCPTRQSRRCC
jgi:hypothetical protein